MSARRRERTRHLAGEVRAIAEKELTPGQEAIGVALRALVECTLELCDECEELEARINRLAAGSFT
jgi:hypothetical protein